MQFKTALDRLPRGETARYRIDYVDFGGGYYIPEHAKRILRQLADVLKVTDHSRSSYFVRGNDILAATTRTSESVQIQRGKNIANFMVSLGVPKDTIHFGGGGSETGLRYVDIEITK